MDKNSNLFEEGCPRGCLGIDVCQAIPDMERLIRLSDAAKNMTRPDGTGLSFADRGDFGPIETVRDLARAQQEELGSTCLRFHLAETGQLRNWLT